MFHQQHPKHRLVLLRFCQSCVEHIIRSQSFALSFLCLSMVIQSKTHISNYTEIKLNISAVLSPQKVSAINILLIVLSFSHDHQDVTLYLMPIYYLWPLLIWSYGEFTFSMQL